MSVRLSASQIELLTDVPQLGTLTYRRRAQGFSGRTNEYGIFKIIEYEGERMVGVHTIFPAWRAVCRFSDVVHFELTEPPTERSHERQLCRFHANRVFGPLPAGLALDRSCLNPSCVNIEHINLVYTRDNYRGYSIGGTI